MCMASEIGHRTTPASCSFFLKVVPIETESNTKPTDESRDSSTGVEVDVTGDASVDTEVINIETETNTSVRSGLNL